ncbi:MAG: hypothetical protein NC548_32875 [Lachnospiraceae bacterium]|nr:hypothetical protein [Lachnospiraceae bacterium]
MKGHLDVKELESYKKADIQKLARDLGVSDAGTIKEIAARCAAVEVDVPGGLTEEETALFDAEAARQEEETGAAAGQTVEEAGNAAGEPQTGQETAEKEEAAETTREAEKPQEKADSAAGGVKVEVVTRYLDQQFNKIKEAGEVFTVDSDRAAVLLAEKVVKIRG